MPTLDRAFWSEHGKKSGEALMRELGGDGGTWRKRIRKAKQEFPEMFADVQYNESTELLSDGSCKSDKLLSMNAEQTKDPDYLLAAHGFDTEAWELVNARNNIWNVYSKCDEGHNISTLYSSRITAKPRVNHFDIERIVEACKGIAPVKVKPCRAKSGGLLEVPLFDMHFGIATAEYYADTLSRICGFLTARTWAQVVVPVGSDLFHCDNFRNTTSNGTVVESIDYITAWGDALKFYSALIECAIENACFVYLPFIKGNHDESMAWAFCNLLQAKYPQLITDLSLAERKVHSFGDVCIGYTHGDKAVKDFDRVFLAEFPEFATARVREIHAAHLHHEIVKDHHGVRVRHLPHGGPTDKWHSDQGYVGAVKGFTLYEYTHESLTDVHYV